MPSPFPGMNPYLENSAYWSGVHHWLINAIARMLMPQVRPRYVVAVEVRTYQTIDEESLLMGIPDNVVLLWLADRAIDLVPISMGLICGMRFLFSRFRCAIALTHPRLNPY